MRLYICVLDEFPDYMTPTLVAHTMLGAHLKMAGHPNYDLWLEKSFRKCVVRVNQKEFDKICALPDTYVGHEKHTLEGRPSCAVPVPVPNEVVPNVLKFAKLWEPNAYELLRWYVDHVGNEEGVDFLRSDAKSEAIKTIVYGPQIKK